MADIFISYASTDRERIAPLVRELQAVGYDIWWDQALKGGHQFSREIEAALKGAKAAVVIWSEASTQSHWVADEAELARREGKLIPILLDEIEPPLGFRQFQTLDFSAWDQATGQVRFDELLSALEECLALQADGTERAPSAMSAPAVLKIPPASIAVLPFVNMSSDPEQEYFSDGISEELLNLLAKIPELTVIARTSSFAFKAKNMPVSEIGKRLRSAHVLEGSVRKAGNRVRITAQLIETEGGSHLWSETWDRDLHDIFAIQDEISAAIVSELKPLLLPTVEAPKTRPQENIEAYQNYLLGHQLALRRTKDDLEKAIVAFDRALALDPGYVEALVGKADALILLSDNGGCYGTTPVDEALAAARPHLDLAARLAPDLDAVWVVRALAHRVKLENIQLLENAQKAIDLNPNNARAWGMLGFAQTNLGRPTDYPNVSFAKGVELEPLSLPAISQFVPEIAKHLKFDEAASLVERGKAINPDSRIWRVGQEAIYIMQGLYGEALDFLIKEREFFPALRVQIMANVFAVILGDHPNLKHPDPRQFDALLDSNRMEEADALYDVIGPSGMLAKVGWDGVRMEAIWHFRHGRLDVAERNLADMMAADQRGWGPGYNLNGLCQAALLHLVIKEKLGDRIAAEAIRKRLEIVIEGANNNPMGPPQNLEIVRGHFEIVTGQIDEGAARLHRHFDTTMMYNYTVANSPVLHFHSDHPEMERLRERSANHLAEQRAFAEKAGALPLPPEVLDPVSD